MTRSHSAVAAATRPPPPTTTTIVTTTNTTITIKWLLLGWVTVCGQVKHLGI